MFGKSLEEIEDEDHKEIVEIIRRLDNEYGLSDSLKNAIKIQLLRNMKNVKNEETGQWETVPAYKTKEGFNRPTFGDLGFKTTA